MIYLTGLIQFFKTPLGTGIAVVMALLIYVQLQRNDAADGAAAECKADVYEQQLTQLRQSVKDMTDLANRNKTAADLADSENAAMEKERDQAVADLRTSQNECRRFTDDQRKRVLNLKR
jgi:uncharacterized membrane protein YccC